ncbi:cortex morphogenetic protein CmpA [Desmospora profundinema]|uniref:Cortex morphogenetic protein CmpA n=1 Tax=Desmospora profundinema TaxID=1571184 RepID=A0ABU1IRX3_9BACL|nr:cortex morphogenetic protein CmpA [Desmospora profundinema]MDR6227551.1 hypothetical protein [Desmospora profundinema]
MPYWLRRQLQHAFQGKDRRQIRILNDCWFQYQQRAELAATEPK